MPRKMENKDFDDKNLTRTLAGEKSGTRLLTFVGDHMLPLMPRSLIAASMPPLVSHVWQQLYYLRERSNRLARWVTNHDGVRLISSRVAQLPMLLPTFIPTLGKPFTLSPVWQRLVEFIWSRQRRQRNNKPIQRVPVADEGQLVNDADKSTSAGELHPNGLLKTFRATEEKQIVNVANGLYPSEFLELVRAFEEKRPVTPADELYPMVINPLPSPGVKELDKFFPQTDIISEHLPAEPVDGGLESESISKSAISQLRKNKIYQTNQIQKPNLRHIKYAGDRLAQWVGKIWPSLTVLDYTPMRRLSRTATQERAEPVDWAVQQPALPFIGDTTEVLTTGEETIQAPGSYHRLVNLEAGNTSLYSSPDRNEPIVLRAMLKRPGLSAIPPAGSLKGLVLSSRLTEPLIPSIGSDLLPTKLTSQQALETSRPHWPVPLVEPLPETVGQKVKAISISEESDSMAPSRVMITPATVNNVTLGEDWQKGQPETPLINRELPRVSGLHHQPSLVAGGLHRQLPFITQDIYLPLVLPVQQYLKPVSDADRSESHRLLGKQDYETYPLPYESAPQPSLESLFTSVASPRLSSNTTGSEGSLTATFQGTAYYGSQPVPELALAPVGQSAEATSVPLPRAEVDTEESMQEVAAPDIDAIARDVYSILKRRLAREKERALGLS